jgi:hypothetical protein
MATFSYPTMLELRQIEQEILPRLTQDDPLLMDGGILPIETVDDHMLAWEQQDNYIGLQQVRGLGGEFVRVKKVGAKRYTEEPGVYGEFIDLDETELMRRRQLGSWDGRVNIDDLVRNAQDQLLQRRLDRIRQIGWTLLATGTFSVAGPTGGVIHTGTYSPQTSTAGVTWATSATAVPLANFRTVQALGPSRGANFGAGALATKAADLGGRLTNAAYNSIRSLGRVNEITLGEDLPTIMIYDEGYTTDAGSFTRFVPNNKVIVIGRRPSGVSVGEYRMTRNINNAGMAPGAFTMVRDSIDQQQPPRRLDVFDGHNGGPVLYFPGAVVIMTV